MKNIHITSPLTIKQAYLDKLKTFCLTASEKNIVLFFDQCHLGNNCIEHHFNPELYHQTLTCGQGTKASNILTSCRLCRTFIREIIKAIPQRPELKQFFKRTQDTCSICAKRKRDYLSLIHRFIVNARSVNCWGDLNIERRDQVFAFLPSDEPIHRHITEHIKYQEETFEHIKVRIMKLEQRSPHHYYAEWIEEQTIFNSYPHNIHFSATIYISLCSTPKDTLKINPLGFFINTFKIRELKN